MNQDIKQNIYDLSREDLTDTVNALKQPPYRIDQILEWLYVKGFHSDSLEQFHSVAGLDELRAQSSLFGELETIGFKVIVSNLCRLGLCEPRHYIETRAGGSVSTQLYDKLAMSPLGAKFVHACRDPNRPALAGDGEATPDGGE